MYSLSLISMTVLFLREGVKSHDGKDSDINRGKEQICLWNGMEKKCYADIVEVPANC